MMHKWLCQADVTLRLVPVNPILIKSGYATMDGPDMAPVSTLRGPAGRHLLLPGYVAQRRAAQPSRTDRARSGRAASACPTMRGQTTVRCPWRPSAIR